jgi:hypothetical protein
LSTIPLCEDRRTDPVESSREGKLVRPEVLADRGRSAVSAKSKVSGTSVPQIVRFE